MKCPYCGHNNPANAKRCLHCGRSLDRMKERKKEQKILVWGIVLIAVILAAGVGAMVGITHVLENSSADANQPQKVRILSTPTPVASESVTSSSAVSASSVQPSETPAPTEAAVTASIVDDARKAELAGLGYTQVTVANAAASSTIYQEGVDNTPHVLYDGQTWSSWQDGVDGDGIGETVTFTLDGTWKMKYMNLRLGNWYGSDDYYYMNNRPKQMTFTFGDKSFSVEFPDEKREFCVEFSDEIEADSVTMRIDSVYKGTAYEDTCINEVDIFGKADGGQQTTAPAAGTDGASGQASPGTGAGSQPAGSAQAGGTSGQTSSGDGTYGYDGSTGYGDGSTYGYDGTGDDSTGYGDGTYGYGGDGTYGYDSTGYGDGTYGGTGY